jgi:hypothetical protein
MVAEAAADLPACADATCVVVRLDAPLRLLAHKPCSCSHDHAAIRKYGRVDAPGQPFFAVVTDRRGAMGRQVKRLPVVKRLKTVPGVGPVTRRTIVAWLVVPGRFKSRKALSAYGGVWHWF